MFHHHYTPTKHSPARLQRSTTQRMQIKAFAAGKFLTNRNCRDVQPITAPSQSYGACKNTFGDELKSRKVQVFIMILR